MSLIKNCLHTSQVFRAGLLTCALIFIGGMGLSVLPASAFADVRKADSILGQTVDERGLSVAQCPDVVADYVVVMDSEGTVYFERNAASPIPIASITKIMTAIVVLDMIEDGQVTLETPITVSAAAASIGESSADLKEGDVMPLEIALKALLVPSGNDAAVALAETLGALLPDGASGAEAAQAAFVSAMNAKAGELGLADTVFENPHGLDDEKFAGNLHSTAADVVKMSQYAMQNEIFRPMVDGKDTSVVVDRADGTRATVELKSTDDLDDIYEYAIGIKTGTTKAAGESFAAAANNGEKELYAAVLHSSTKEQRFSDAKTLFEWVYAHEISYQLANSPQTTNMTVQGKTDEVPVIAEAAHHDWIDKTVKVTLKDPETAVTIFDLNGNVSQSLAIDKITGNIKAGDKVGTITFKQRNKIISELDLVACEDLAAPGLFDGFGIWWDRLFRGLSGQPQVASDVTLNETPLVNDKTQATAAQTGKQ